MILVLWRVAPKAQSSAAVEGLWVVTALFPLWFIGAWMSGRWESLTASITRGRWMLGIVLFAASAVVSIVLKHQHCPGAWYNLAALSSLPGLVLILGGARHLGLSQKKVEPLCRWLSQFSYPCYILHVPLLLLVNRAAGILMPNVAAEHPFLRVGLSLGVVLALLAAFGPALERFFMAWRSRVLSGETRA
jgi:peptidoglycan/LPS O-acetylase OafA/YrhL